jgi:hypothetical protein
MSANLIVGKDPTGNKVPVAVDAAGQLKVTGGGGGGSTDMTVANAQLIAINANTDGLEGKADTGNALLTTQAADTALIKDEAVAIDAKLPALSSGRIPVESNNAASQVFNYTATGAVALNSVIVGPIECSQFREISVQASVLGTGSQLNPQISNDGSVWVNAHYVNSFGTVNALAINNTAVYNYLLLGARYFRMIQTAAQTAGTTTLVAYASQQATPKLYQSVTGSVSITGTASFSPNTGAVNWGPNTYHTLVSAASTNATSVKVGNGMIFTLVVSNTSSSFKYLKMFNLAVAPTMGTSTPILNIPIAPNSTLDVGTNTYAMRFNAGTAYAITGGSALLDTTAVAAGDVIVNMNYA